MNPITHCHRLRPSVKEAPKPCSLTYLKAVMVVSIPSLEMHGNNASSSMSHVDGGADKQGPLQEEQTGSADNGECAHVGVTENLESMRLIPAPQQTVAAVEKTLDVDCPGGDERCREQNRAHHKHRQPFSCGNVKSGQQAAKRQPHQREPGACRCRGRFFMRSDGQNRQKCEGVPEAGHGSARDSSSEGRFETLASSNVAMWLRQAAAASINGMARAAPVPSPSLISRLSKGLRPRC